MLKDTANARLYQYSEGKIMHFAVIDNNVEMKYNMGVNFCLQKGVI